jgi:hypothetical protein
MSRGLGGYAPERAFGFKLELMRSWGVKAAPVKNSFGPPGSSQRVTSIPTTTQILTPAWGREFSAV